ncbi:uncharacterized protein RCC_03275 [Ramularia collo-cygni]|uniref:Uncharacterized protein n=1 Tax=Ramularia collo-cygni TaxID=112498 RepID=A0A2D3UPR1_9PEZI|nr:uncharacterized protein RCC_03275 [Ramularia collo-cygni]CZT17441.1 uncharacterized protein RCC_03275 [Ramularia collo-cygni]
MSLSHPEAQQDATRLAVVGPVRPTDPPTLLNLAANVKNIIYRSALLEEDPIVITSARYSRNGGLLGTCKQVRKEALSIYYEESHFKHAITNFDPRPIKNWMDRMPLCISKHLVKFNAVGIVHTRRF